MKYAKTLQALMAVGLMLVAANAMAADKSKTTMTVTSPVSVSGTTLAPGDYQVTWDGNSGQVAVTILQGKKVMATASAKVEARAVAYGETALVTTKKGNELDVVEIRPEGLKEALLLEPEAAAHQ